MSAKIRVVKMVFLVLCLGLSVLQSGCSSTGGGGTQAPTNNSNAIHLALSTTSGSTAVLADGRSTIPIRIQVTNGSGAGMPGVPVTFATTAGVLSESAIVRSASRDLLSDAQLSDAQTVTTRADSNGSVTVNTDGTGIAQVFLTAGITAEAAVVTADVQGFRTNIVIDFVPGSPAHVQFTASPTTVNAAGTSTLTATVTDTNGNPNAGVTVTLSLSTNTSGAALSAVSGVTDANGQVTVKYTAGIIPGADTLQAQVTSSVKGSTSITVSASQNASQVTSTKIAAGTTNVVADGTSTVAMRATVVVASGSPAGILVTFTTTAGRLSTTTASTDTGGIATVNLIAGTSLGTATVTATAAGFSDTATVTFVPGPPAVVQLSATPTIVTTGGNATITATVLDAHSNPVGNQTLTFFPPTWGTLSATSGNTNANGQLTVTYTGTTPGTETVQARAVNNVVGSVAITIASAPVTSGPVTSAPVTSINVVSGAPSIVADGASTVAIRATVGVASGGSPAGILVSFTTTAGGLSPAMAVTDASGVATVNLIAASSLGTATVTATAGGFSANTTVMFVAGAPRTVTLNATPSTVNVGATSMIQAAVTDATGNPTGGQTLVFSFTTNATGASLGGSSTRTGATDADGQFTVPYTAGATSGTDIVQARTTNGITRTISITVTPRAVASSIDLRVSSPQLGSNGAGTVTLTALLRDATNNVVSGVPVNFSADSGSIQVTSGTTGATGTATALLTTGGDPRNRTITVTATTGNNLSSTNTVQVTGTTLTVSGANTLVLGGTTPLTILLRDSGGTVIPNQDITVSSMVGNTLSATMVRTDANGQATVRVTANVPPQPGNNTITDTITASALGATATATLSVSAANFVFTIPAPTTQVPLNTPRAVTVHWDQAGVNQVGQTINFFATRGNFAATATCPGGVVPTISATTDANGNATVNICSTNAGPAVISATANVSSGPSSQDGIEFVATTVASLILQVFPTALGVNVSGTTQQSIVTAVVRDASGNLVKNQTVSFSLTDVSGGQISPASAVTDSFGRASTVYTAGAAPSASNGVRITAAVGGITDTVTLTVAQQPLSVILGTGNVVHSADPPNADTQYAVPYSVLVTDANGNPVSNATVNLRVVPTRYQKGFYSPVFDARGVCSWQKTLTIRSNTDPDDIDQACQNEDINLNGILDPGEDHNSNGKLDPGNVATVDHGTVTTNASGSAAFNVVYAKEFTWVEVSLEARAVVTGSEGSSKAIFFLPGLASDFNNCSISPPGQTSPFGIATTCACDERTNPMCSGGAGTTSPIVIAVNAAAGATSVPADGTSTVAIRATVLVSSGSSAGLPVTFNTTAGTLSSTTATTDINGVATVMLTAATSLGTARVTTAAAGFSATATVSFIAGAPATVSLTANPPAVNAQVTSTITATVLDANTNPVSGQSLTFSFRQNVSGARLSALSGTADTNGQITLTYTAGSTPTTPTTPDIVQARATNGVTGAVNITVTNSPAGSVVSITLAVTESSGTPNDNTITADGSATATVTATLLDGNGRPVSNGIVVNFTTSLGSITNQATTAGGNGIATATFTAGTRSGNATVTARSGTVTASAVITLAAGPVNSLVLLNISNTSIGVRGSGTNETSNLTFQARDSNGNLVADPVPGNPASGTKVDFTLASGGLGGGESVSPTQVTAVNGQVITTLQSGTKAGTVRVIAFVDANGNGAFDAGEIASQAISIVITGGPPWGENLSVAVNPLNIAGLNTLGLKDTITAFLSDRFSNPVPDGTAVSFFSDFAGITGAAVSTSGTIPGTTAATATATLTSQGPLPPDGFVAVTPSTLSGSDARVLALVVHPTNANQAYAATDGGGVFRTTNGLNANAGQVSWTQVGRAQTGLTNGVVRALQLDPTNPSIIYAATNAGVFRSTGSGDTWVKRSGRERITGEVVGTLTTTTQAQPFPLAFPSDGNRARTVVRVNGAVTILYEFIGVQDIQLLPGAGNLNDSVSIDYDLGAVITAARTTALALDPTNPLGTDPTTTRTLYAGTQGAGVFRSSNSGFSWAGINSGLSNPSITALVALSSTTLYAGTFGGGVFRTFNATSTDPNAPPVWCQVNNGLTSTVINTLATDSARVYAGTFLGGVFSLTDGRPAAGVTDCRTVAAPTWTAPTTNVNTADFLNGFVSDIVIDPNNTATLYAATLGDGTRSIEGNAAEGGVFRSTDSGVTWTRIPALPASGTQLAPPPADLPDNRVYALGISAANSDALYVGVAGRNVVRLIPSTVTYTVINGTPPNQVTNNIFASGTVLFSGTTRVTLTEISDSFQDRNRTLSPNGFGPLPDNDIFNGGLQSFIYTVSDGNGNPITGGSTVTVTTSAGILSGDTSLTIPDAQQGNTVFNVAWQNNTTTAGNVGANLIVSVNSAANGNASAAISRILIGPVTISPTSGSLPATGGSLSFCVSGGSETLLSQGGGYGVATNIGTVSSTSINANGCFTLITDASAKGLTITVTVRDLITGQRAQAVVTQASQ